MKMSEKKEMKMCEERPETKKRRWYWCAFHQEILLKETEEWFRSRIETIYRSKPFNEIPIRLDNFRLVLSKLPPELDELWDEVQKTEDRYQKANRRYNIVRSGNLCLEDFQGLYTKVLEAKEDNERTWDRFEEAILRNKKVIRALYEKEQPNGAWNWNTMTLDMKEE